MSVTRCAQPNCSATAADGCHLCDRHEHETAYPFRSHDYEAARLDPTTDRDRWDVWDDGGLEAPGEDEW